MQNAINTPVPSYHVEVITREGKKKEYSFQESDLLFARAKAFARMEFELENNSAISVNVFLVTEAQKSNVSNGALPGYSENLKIEQILMPELAHSPRMAEVYNEELEKIIRGTEQKRKSVFNAISKMKEAIDDIEEAESLFNDDHWMFDWVAAMEKRVGVLETAVRSEIGYLKTA